MAKTICDVDCFPSIFICGPCAATEGIVTVLLLRDLFALIKGGFLCAPVHLVICIFFDEASARPLFQFTVVVVIKGSADGVAYSIDLLDAIAMVVKVPGHPIDEMAMAVVLFLHSLFSTNCVRIKVRF